MIARAVFWMGLVSVLMPREPDIGFGRPQAFSSSASTIQRSVAERAAYVGRDGGINLPVDGWAAVFLKFRENVLEAVPRMKVEIKANLNDRWKL